MMKIQVLKSITLGLFAVLFSMSAFAQITYGVACAGDECGDYSSAVFVEDYECELGTLTNFQVEIDAGVLCPNTDGVVQIKVCGNVHSTITVQGGTAPFLVPVSVPCPCAIDVSIVLDANGEPYSCKRLGVITATVSTF